MAKKYRLKTKDGKDIVTVIYGGRAAYGRDTLQPKDVLKGKTPRQHCEELIASRGKGEFKTLSDNEDVCYLLGGNYFGVTYGAEYSYHYAVCEELEMTGTLNNKVTTMKELGALKGGERVVIKMNQPVTWKVTNTPNMIQPAQNETTYAFTMPKTGLFIIKATGKCDPSKSKTVTVKIAEAKKPVKPTPENSKSYKRTLAFPIDQFLRELKAAMIEYGIKEKNDVAGFLANVEHETQELAYMEENPNYSLKRWREMVRQSNIQAWLAQHPDPKEAQAAFDKLSWEDKLNIMYNHKNGIWKKEMVGNIEAWVEYI